MPKASIIITTHNRPHLLPRAINSARASGSEIEIVVVDDASSQETAEICHSVSGFTYVRVERSQGVAGARNIGLVASHGEYISFLDDDDQRLPNSIDKQIETLERDTKAVLIYGQAIPEDADWKHSAFPAHCPQGDILWDLLSRNFIPCSSAVFRRDCLSRVGMLDSGISGIDDWDLWVRIAEMFSIAVMATPVVISRRPTQTSASGGPDAVDLIERSRIQFREHWIKLPRVGSAHPSRKRAAWHSFSKNISERLWEDAFGSLRKFEFQHAGKSVVTALRLHPTALLSAIRSGKNASPQDTRLAAARGRGDLSHARKSFKRIRSSRTW